MAFFYQALETGNELKLMGYEPYRWQFWFGCVVKIA